MPTSLDRIVPTQHLHQMVRAAVLYDWMESVDLFREEPSVKSWHLNLTPAVAKMLDWYVRHFPGEASTCIGDIQRETHKRWDLSASDTLQALRQTLSLDGKLTDQQSETYFALLEPRKDLD